MRVALALLVCLLFDAPAFATTYYVRGSDGNDNCTGLVDVGGASGACAWKTIGKATTVLVAGDTVIVEIGQTYNEAVSETTSGTAGNPITYRAAVDCVTNNGATIAGSCARVRRLTASGNYVTFRGFEVTAIGMSSDTNRRIVVGGTGSIIENNYVHHTEGTSACVAPNNSSLAIVRGNNIQYCGARQQIYATDYGPYNIVAGVNDKVSFSIQGGAAQTITLTPGAARTSVQVATDIEAGLTGGAPCQVSSFPNSAALCDHILTVWTDTSGPTSSIELLAVANSAYAELGMTVGQGTWFGSFLGIGPANTNNDTLIENNVISHVSDYIYPGSGDRQVVRDNTIGPPDEYNSIHIDFIQAGGLDYLLVENNFSVDNGTVGTIDNHFMLNEGASSPYIVRYNSTCRSRGSASMHSGADNLYFYNNTFYDNQAYMFNVTNGGQVYMSQAGTNAVARNNIWYNSRTLDSVYTTPGTIDRDYDLWYLVNDPVETNDVNADPLVTDGPNCDFTLRSDSPAIDEGGPLTTVAASDTGSGTTLVLTDAKMFQDGWAGVTPDTIAVGTVGNIAQIVSINYATGEVTIDRDIARVDGADVFLYADSRGDRVLYGDRPDIGAFERVPSATPIMIRMPRRKG